MIAAKQFSTKHLEVLNVGSEGSSLHSVQENNIIILLGPNREINWDGFPLLLKMSVTLVFQSSSRQYKTSAQINLFYY